MNKIIISGLICLMHAQAAPISLSKEQLHALGKKIWQRECGMKESGLIHWHEREPFPSLGIGHFIWYPTGATKSFEQTFPDLINFMIKKGEVIPVWLSKAINNGCPWKDRETFIQFINGKQLQELRIFLAATVDLQAEYIVHRFAGSIEKMILQAPKNKRSYIKRQFDLLSGSTQGLFAMIDYLHFKGAGTNRHERYNNQGWGLVQVLQNMKPVPTQTALAEFNRTAKLLLHQRVVNSKNRQMEERFLAGWFARIDSYCKEV